MCLRNNTSKKKKKRKERTHQERPIGFIPSSVTVLRFVRSLWIVLFPFSFHSTLSKPLNCLPENVSCWATWPLTPALSLRAVPVPLSSFCAGTFYTRHLEVIFLRQFLSYHFLTQSPLFILPPHTHTLHFVSPTINSLTQINSSALFHAFI